MSRPFRQTHCTPVVNTITAPHRAGIEPDFRALRVLRKEQLAREVWRFSLCRQDGAPMEPFAAGSHLTVQVPAGPRRNYSLCSDPADSSCWQIAVKRDGAGRGGSISMVDDVRANDLLGVSAPRNNFPLHARATEFLFIAGGIGITPIFSMLQQLASRVECRFKLVYCTRDAGHTAFLEELGAARFAGRVQLHHDHGDLNQALDLWPLFETPGPAQVYCCGPRGLMEAVADMSGHWPSGSIHFESFGADATARASNSAFDVRLHRSATVLSVGAGQTILEVLRANGHRVPSSCESGTCGSCRTGLLGGEADHRDMVLGEGEKSSQIMVCVSRARAGELVLDL